MVDARKPGTAIITAKTGNYKLKCKVKVIKAKKGVLANELYEELLSWQAADVTEYGETETINLHSAYFTTGDINNDGIKELFVSASSNPYSNSDPVYIFTVKSGAAFFSGKVYNTGSKPKISKKYGVLYTTWWAAGCGNSYYVSLDRSGKIYYKKQICRFSLSDRQYEYSIDEKSVGKKAYERAYKKYNKSLKKISKFIANSPSNRKKVFK